MRHSTLPCDKERELSAYGPEMEKFGFDSIHRVKRSLAHQLADGNNIEHSDKNLQVENG